MRKILGIIILTIIAIAILSALVLALMTRGFTFWASLGIVGACVVGVLLLTSLIYFAVCLIS